VCAEALDSFPPRALPQLGDMLGAESEAAWYPRRGDSDGGNAAHRRARGGVDREGRSAYGLSTWPARVAGFAPWCCSSRDPTRHTCAPSETTVCTLVPASTTITRMHSPRPDATAPHADPQLPRPARGCRARVAAPGEGAATACPAPAPVVVTAWPLVPVRVFERLRYLQRDAATV
jgi:hypothetical protein